MLTFQGPHPGTGDLEAETLMEHAPDALYPEIPALVAQRGVGGIIAYTLSPAGEPRGVRLRCTGLTAVGGALARGLGLGRQDRTLPVTSLAHRSGTLMTVAATLAAGGTLVLSDPPSPEGLATLIGDHQVSWLLAHITDLPLLLTAPIRRQGLGRRGRSLRFLLLMPGPLAPELRGHLTSRWGVEVLTGYGWVETTWLVSCETPSAEHAAGRGTGHNTGLGPGMDLGETPPGSVGFPLVGRVRIGSGDQAGEAPPGRPGTIRVGGEAIMVDYLGEPEESARVCQEDWFITGETGFLGEGGRLHLLSRSTL